MHEGERFVVVEKPTRMLSVPGIGPEKADCVILRVREMFPRARGPMMVHRLDYETSGLLVVALDEDAQRDLSRQFETRDVEKAYVALVEGDVARVEGEISLPMRLDVDRRPYQIVDFVHGKPAVTRFRVMTHETDRTRVWFEPLTGRTHQLRVHAATPVDAFGPGRGGLGCPIVGDALYGARGDAERLTLHATWIAFREPGSARRVEFSSAVPF